MVTENGNFEEENLQKSLQHMLIGLQRRGEVAVANLQQVHAECMGDSIFVAIREDVEAVEFLFSDAQCMSGMVGVGLEKSKVLVRSGYEVEVMQLSENNWKRPWEKVFSQVKDSESFELVAIKMPKLQGDHVKSTSLPAEDILRKFGVSLKDFPETHVITRNCKEEQSGQFVPLVRREEQHACYVFKVRRYLYRLLPSKLNQDEIKCLMQDYKLLMFVNLAMTHLNRYDTNDHVRLTDRNPELPSVIKVPPGG